MANPAFKFKDWEIQDKLGEGGQSLILLASRQKLNGDIQRAAIRLMKEDGRKTPEVRKMEAEQFAHEYEILSRLSSAYIAHVVDFGLEPVPWIATELIEGMDLGKYLHTNGKADSKTWVRFATNLVSGLAHAHSKKVIHQDIKPGNIMISEGTAIWIDFSSATLIGQEDIGYRGGASTPVYNSPERLRHLGFSPASDIFSLGIVLMELATGKHPWNINTLPRDMISLESNMANLMLSQPISFDGLTAIQKTVLKKMLAIDPVNRPTASELLEMLDASHIGGATGLQRDATVLNTPAPKNKKVASPTQPRLEMPTPKKKPVAQASKPSPKPSNSFFQKYRRKWWFWILAIYAIGFLPIFGYGYFLYRESSTKLPPVKEHIRSISTWLIVFFPVFAYTSWPLALIWGRKTGNKTQYILGSIQLAAAVGMGAITSYAPRILDATGRETIKLPPEFGWPVLLGLVAAVISTAIRPRYEQKGSASN